MIIYKTTNIINGKIYVGQDSKNDEQYLGSGIRLRYAISKYGKSNFKKEILCECSSQDELDSMEKYWISKLNSTNPEIGYNLNSGGKRFNPKNGTTAKKIGLAHKGRTLSDKHRKKLSVVHTGKRLSDETKHKMSVSRKGQIPWNKGVPQSKETRKKVKSTWKSKDVCFSDEHREKISKALKGRVFSEEHKQKISESKRGKSSWNKGVPMKEETKQKLRERNLGKKHSDETKNKMKLAHKKRSKRGDANE